jgi:hypothetical protein
MNKGLTLDIRFLDPSVISIKLSHFYDYSLDEYLWTLRFGPSVFFVLTSSLYFSRLLIVQLCRIFKSLFHC